MNAEDRFQAILRHPLYRNDWRIPLRRLYDLIRSGKSPADVGVTLPPDMSTGWITTQYESFLGHWGVRRAVQLDDKNEVNKILRELREGNTSIFTRQMTSTRTLYTFDADLERPLGMQAKRALKEMEAERKKRGIEEKRTKANMVDLWIVWDAMQRPGNSLVSITRSLFDVPRKPPAHDDVVRRHYERVKRAYEKACAMIEEVGRDLGADHGGEIYVRQFRYRPGYREGKDYSVPSLRDYVNPNKPWGV